MNEITEKKELCLVLASGPCRVVFHHSLVEKYGSEKLLKDALREYGKVKSAVEEHWQRDAEGDWRLVGVKTLRGEARA